VLFVFQFRPPATISCFQHPPFQSDAPIAKPMTGRKRLLLFCPQETITLSKNNRGVLQRSIIHGWFVGDSPHYLARILTTVQIQVPSSEHLQI
jgi:hypothetical protein